MIAPYITPSDIVSGIRMAKKTKARNIEYSTSDYRLTIWVAPDGIHLIISVGKSEHAFYAPYVHPEQAMEIANGMNEFIWGCSHGKR